MKIGTFTSPVSSTRMKPNILILEDNFLLAEELAYVVKKWLNGTPLLAATVSDALKLISEDIVLAFLDIEVLDGVSYPVAKKLITDKIPLIFVSGIEKETLPEEFKETPFLPKPASDRKLVQLAKSLTHASG
jgi:DNA-binding LytR/AlgR family response regulator